jgi:hypothetical protein
LKNIILIYAKCKIPEQEKRAWQQQFLDGIIPIIILCYPQIFPMSIFGSDLHLSAKKITGRAEIQWAAIAAAREKVGIFAESYLMERLV